MKTGLFILHISRFIARNNNEKTPNKLSILAFRMLYIFIISCAIIIYNYAGYAVIAQLFNIFTPKKDNREPDTHLPGISFIVAAYNEDDFIAKKIANSLEQDYPAEKIEFIFVTDGSTDNTAAIVQQYPAIRLLHQPERNGKSAAINRAVATAKNEILVFSDANTLLNREAVARIARHYADPKTGGVAGEKKVISAGGNDEVGAGEGLYWKYESLLKKIDARFYSVVGAAGELFSLRTALYEPLSPAIVLDDFVLSLRVAEKGYRVTYAPEAFAMEDPSFSFRDEQKRKVRIAAGGFQSIGLLSSLLLFWRHPRLSFLYISHRVLRWAATPFCLVLAFLSNAILCFAPHNTIYILLFAGQLLFYGMAAAAALLPGKQPGLLKLPYYFTFMNISVLLGFVRFLRGKQSGVWEKARRIQSSMS
jgi:cellulose synthase/poly-beta-1,6-N-acetylglucosamine synthase-like glycosyltransferase